MSLPGAEAQPVSGQELALLFRRVSRLMSRASHRCDHAHHAQARVLGIVRERGSISQAELLDLLDVRSSSLSELLGKLERAGLITRTRNEQDRRGFVVSAAGGEAEAAAPGPEMDREGAESVFACLGEDERRQLGGLLSRLVEALEREPSGLGGGHGPGAGGRRGCMGRGRDCAARGGRPGRRYARD